MFQNIATPYAVTYKEQFYKLFHVQYQQTAEDIMENIYWLERAVAADFANPQNALAKIDTKEQWEKYRYLFMMHVNLKLIEQNLSLGRIWYKQTAHFYDAPWKEEYLRNLDIAEQCFQTGLYYWQEAQSWAEKANQGKFYFLHLTDIQYWEDERQRIYDGDLDYKKIITRELKNIENVRAQYEAMDFTY